ncbi:12123_t:CDS:2 [Funneliformis geosporum]|uniref:GPI mannosyltransferase 2 n=1 Tax=Funneliformis geosporum TaxID=1117311 RepID=A0A9W4SF07_9GLOM|nr:12123_t:CDS:2 [Funneliformis geosporum]
MDPQNSQTVKYFTYFTNYGYNNKHIYLILKFSIISRLLTWLIALISTLIVDDYDSSVDTILEGRELSIVQKIFNVSFRAFLRWDSFYFIHLSEEGYIYEQEHAFFPLLPLLARGLSNSVTSIFYILTPSGMFMSAMYTESLFALLSFLGMRLFYEGKLWSAAFIWSLSSFTRSNGITQVGFFVYKFLIKDINRINGINAKVIFVRLIKTIILSFIVLLGFLIFQCYGYYHYCILYLPQRPWCNGTIPLLYSFVQSFYWNCGFLNYYEVKQIPNFLLASPMIFLSFYGIYSYSKFDFKRILTLGLQQRSETTLESSSSPYHGTHELLPFIYLWAILLVYSINFMHVQVITRFFSSQPIVYWFVTDLFIKSLSEDASRWDKFLGYGMLVYFILYGGSGIILFANFFPPA